jgi:hypothetical protein
MELRQSRDRRIDMGAAARAHATTRSWTAAFEPLSAYRATLAAHVGHAELALGPDAGMVTR